MSKIEEYVQIKEDLAASFEWAEKIGKEYLGGGGGVGRLNSLRLARGSGAPTIYFQEEDSSPILNAMPEALFPYLEAAIAANFMKVLVQALDAQEKDRKTAAEEALREYALLLQGAGLDVPAT